MSTLAYGTFCSQCGSVKLLIVGPNQWGCEQCGNATDGFEATVTDMLATSSIDPNLKLPLESYARLTRLLATVRQHQQNIQPSPISDQPQRQVMIENGSAKTPTQIKSDIEEITVTAASKKRSQRGRSESPIKRLRWKIIRQVHQRQPELEGKQFWKRVYAEGALAELSWLEKGCPPNLEHAYDIERWQDVLDGEKSRALKALKKTPPEVQ